MAEIEKMDLESEDLVGDRIEQLKRMFPEIVTECGFGEREREGKGSGIDFDKLKLLLGEEVDEEQERYAFTWPGKKDAIRLAQEPSTFTLRPLMDKSEDWDTT